MAVGYAFLGMAVLHVVSIRTALAQDEGLGNFRRIAEPAGLEKPGPPEWGPVPTGKLSLANVAPGLFPFFNNGPVFGLPGTVVGDFWKRTELTGDWGGARTDLARHGVFVDLYSTSAYQDVTSGGLKTGSAFVQNTQLSINLDTGRAGLWPGGLFHVTFQSRYGSAPQNTFIVGSYVPQYTGLVEPGPLLWQDTLPSEYFWVQAINKRFSILLGKISDVFIPDQTLFGDSYKSYFANFNLNKNPMTTNFYNPTAWAALGALTPAPWLVVGGGVLDPNSMANTFAKHAYDKVNLYLTAIAKYNLAGRPGQFSPAYNWSNKPKINLKMPFGELSPEQAPQAVAALLGGSTAGLPVNYRKDSWFLIANASQYLFVFEDPASIEPKIKSGQPLSGIGVFGRLGYAPPNTNPVTRDFSFALVARGVVASRNYDSFGVGFFYNAISNKLKNNIEQLTDGTRTVKDEKGIEIFYDFAINPAIRLIPGYQHIWNPLSAQVATNRPWADIFLLRLTLAL
jgi:hypothetical protein